MNTLRLKTLNIVTIFNLQLERNISHKHSFVVFYLVFRVVLLFCKQLAKKPIVAS
jgi:hypothetical protein